MSRQSEIYKTQRPTRRISVYDELADGEIERCRAERKQRNGNGKCPKHVAARLALIPEAIRLADAETNISDNVGLWSRIYKRHLVRLSESLKQSDNGSASHKPSQNGETSTGPASRGRSNIDATIAVLPMW
jgi:hypothetical protein